MDNKSFKKKFAIWFWSIVVAGIGAIVLLFWLITKGWLGYLPPLDELQNPKNKYATEVISSDMQLLGRYYRNENRVSVDYVDISPNMINALIATEDVRYYDHTGVDFKSLMRAVMKLGKAGGGSTITQQLAKQLWSPRANNIF
jgi:penicillin-binding protein 1A